MKWPVGTVCRVVYTVSDYGCCVCVLVPISDPDAAVTHEESREEIA
jgi:hypothetical protein